MEKEIQQAACMYAANTENWATSDGLQTEEAKRIQNAFVAGVLWHIQNQWHEAEDIPPSKNISILELYRKKNGGFGSRLACGQEKKLGKSMLVENLVSFFGVRQMIYIRKILILMIYGLNDYGKRT